MVMAKFNKSHFDKPVLEITIWDLQKMSKEDLAEFIIEHPWSTQAGINDYGRETLRSFSTHGELFPMAKKIVTGVYSWSQEEN